MEYFNVSNRIILARHEENGKGVQINIKKVAQITILAVIDTLPHLYVSQF